MKGMAIVSRCESELTTTDGRGTSCEGWFHSGATGVVGPDRSRSFGSSREA